MPKIKPQFEWQINNNFYKKIPYTVVRDYHNYLLRHKESQPLAFRVLATINKTIVYKLKNKLKYVRQKKNKTRKKRKQPRLNRNRLKKR
jgi:hypothetical protein